MPLNRLVVAAVLLAGAAAAQPPASPAKPGEDPDRHLLRVRVTEAKRLPVANEIVLTGDIQAQAQTNVAFRSGGKVSERFVEVGDHVSADQVLAKLEPLSQQANLDNARAALVSAEAQAKQAQLTYDRQKQLLSGGFATRSNYDNAEQQLRTSLASVEAAKAAVGTAREQLSYTDLRAGVAGIVTSREFETGQVVQAGQTVLVLAHDGPRDAVFNVDEALAAGPPPESALTVALQSDPSVTASGRVREVAPTVDQTSGTVRVKIGLATTPAAMGLGTVVTGHARFARGDAVVLPWSALYRAAGKPAVWVYDPQTRKVALRDVTVDRYVADMIALRGGIQPGERVVVAGIQFLRPGQVVAAVEEAAR